MKVLKALLAVLTTLAVALTAILLLWQDKSAPRYIKIYENEQKLFLAKTAPRPSGKTARLGCFCVVLQTTQKRRRLFVSGVCAKILSNPSHSQAGI